MGITHDQVAKGQLNRLRYHIERLQSILAEDQCRRGAQRYEHDAQCWAIVATMRQSGGCAMQPSGFRTLVDHLQWYVEEGHPMDAESTSRYRDANNIEDPRWGIEVLRLMVAIYHAAHPRYEVGLDQGSDISASDNLQQALARFWSKDAYDCAPIEQQLPPRARQAFVTALQQITVAEWQEWGGNTIPDCYWLGMPNVQTETEDHWLVTAADPKFFKPE